MCPRPSCTYYCMVPCLYLLFCLCPNISFPSLSPSFLFPFNLPFVPPFLHFPLHSSFPKPSPSFLSSFPSISPHSPFILPPSHPLPPSPSQHPTPSRPRPSLYGRQGGSSSGQGLAVSARLGQSLGSNDVGWDSTLGLREFP